MWLILGLNHSAVIKHLLYVFIFYKYISGSVLGIKCSVLCKKAVWIFLSFSKLNYIINFV